MAHTELGRKILDRLVEDLKDLATVDSYPKLDGRNMVMVIAPSKKVPHEVPKTRRAARDEARAEEALAEEALAAPDAAVEVAESAPSPEEDGSSPPAESAAEAPAAEPAAAEPAAEEAPEEPAAPEPDADPEAEAPAEPEEASAAPAGS
jgi:translation initiation factor IF-3